MFRNFYKENFMIQKMMRTVIIALIPIVVASIFFFGWRSLALIAWSTLVGTLTEYIFERTSGNKKKKVSEAVFVTSILYALTLPPSLPFWIAAVGIVFGVLFGKLVFGGFGRNIFNPALVGRAFIYISFPEPLTIKWTSAANSFPGGFGKYLMEGVDSVAQATPMLYFRELGETMDYKNLLMGNISGSLGETSAVLLILAAAYLIYKKVASWEIMGGVALGYMGLSLILYSSGSTEVLSPIYGVLSGGFLLGTVFMATDPISSAKTKEGKWIYGILIGIITVVIRAYALFAEGIMFAILVGNMFAPLIDEMVRYIKTKKKEKLAGGV